MAITHTHKKEMVRSRKEKLILDMHCGRTRHIYGMHIYIQHNPQYATSQAYNSRLVTTMCGVSESKEP